MAWSRIVPFSLIVASGFLFTEGYQRYDGYHLLRTIPHDNLQLKKLAILHDFEVDFWTEPRGTGVPVDIFVDPHRLRSVMTFLTEHGLETEIVFNDAEKLIHRSPTPKERFGLSPELDWKDYHTLETINDWLKKQAEIYYEIATVITAGKSFEGRDLVGLRIAHKQDLPVVFIEGGIHAREWIAPASATWITQQLLNSTNKLIKSFEWHIFPVVNPDGYEYTHTEDRTWRKSRNPNSLSGDASPCVGVDLNRNFPFKWQETVVPILPEFLGFANFSSKKPNTGVTCQEIYSGPFAASEPEVQGLLNYLHSIYYRTRIYFSLHSYSQLLLYPFSHSKSKTPANVAELERVGTQAVTEVALKFGTWYFSGHSASVLYEAVGTSLDYASFLNISYCFIAELRDKGEYGFLLPKEQIVPTAKEAFHMLYVILQEASDFSFPSFDSNLSLPPSPSPLNPVDTKKDVLPNYDLRASPNEMKMGIDNFQPGRYFNKNPWTIYLERMGIEYRPQPRFDEVVLKSVNNYR